MTICLNRCRQEVGKQLEYNFMCFYMEIKISHYVITLISLSNIPL